MSEDQTNRQVTLISSDYKANQPIYNVEKQGVLFFKKLKNKKFRIILNVIHIGSEPKVHNFNQFNHILRSSFEKDKKYIQQNKNTKTQIQNKNNQSRLTVLTCFKQTNDKTAIVIMNAYLNSQYSPDILLFGYLISSEILYHDFQNQLSQNSALTSMLTRFDQIARKIKLSTFNQDNQINVQMSKSINFRYLLLKCQSEKECKEETNKKNQFDQFYRFDWQSANSKINKALNTLLDFFPIRSSISLQIHQAKTNKKQINNQIMFTQIGQKQILSILQQFELKNMGRKILNYQFTSTTIENLAFQLCQYFNNNQPMSIQEIYHKILQNTKQSIVEQCLNFYEQLISDQFFQGNKINLKSIKNYDKRTIIPLSSISLQQTLSIASDKMFDYFSQISLNCMNLHEHLQMKELLKEKIKLYQQNIASLNNRKGEEFANLCFSSLDIDQSQLKPQQNHQLSSENIKEVFTFISSKIQCFSNDCISLFTQKDQNSIYYNQSFMRLIKSYIDKLSNTIVSSVKQSQLNLKQINSQINNLKDQNVRLRNDRKKLQQQYQLQMLISEEYKCQLKQFISTGSETSIHNSSLNASTQLCSPHPFFNSKKPQAYYKQLYRMKRQIQELEEQIKDKNNHNDDLMEILDKLDDSVVKGAFQKKNQSIFNQQTKALIHQLNQKINTFYQIVEEVKKVEKQYESAKTLLLKEKEKIMEEKKLFATESNEIRTKFQKANLQNKKLLEIINESKQTIEYHKRSNQIQKKTIQELQKRNVQFHCSIADLQAQSQTYKKCVVLLIEQSLKGKSQSLLKFFKYLSNPQLKQLLKPVLLRK